MKVLIVTIALFMASTIPSIATHGVYIVHGYGGNGLEFNKIPKQLEMSGYNYTVFRYNSFRDDVDSVALKLCDRLISDGYDTVSFVTHSMGGIVVRAIGNCQQKHSQLPAFHRVVMLAPPNAGSPLADFYSRFPLVCKIAGPNIHNLTTCKVTGAMKYPVPVCDIGIVIGNVNKTRRYGVALPEYNDGVLSVASAVLPSARDLFFVESSHVGMLFNKDVRLSIVEFLDKGEF